MYDRSKSKHEKLEQLQLNAMDKEKKKRIVYAFIKKAAFNLFELIRSDQIEQS